MSCSELENRWKIRINNYIRNAGKSLNLDIPNDINITVCKLYDKRLYVTKIMTLIRLDSNIFPKRYVIKLAFDSSISELNEAIESITNVPHNHLVICEIWDNKIYKIFKNHEPIEILQDNKTVCYELQSNKQIKQVLLNENDDYKLNQCPFIPIYHQNTIENQEAKSYK